MDEAIKKRAFRIKEIFVNKFDYRFRDEDSYIFIASPGRVNLIGEHTDYNGGLAIPAAVDKYVFLFGKRNQSREINIFSTVFNKISNFNIDNIKKDKTDTWSNYIRGVVKEFKNKGTDISGFDIVIDSELPMGSGMSSSAALEVGCAVFIQEVFKTRYDCKTLIDISRKAENDFVGVACGYLDQFAVLYGKKDNAIFLDFSDLSYRYIPFEIGDNLILIIDSKEERNLSNTDYNKRRKECDTILKTIISLEGEDRINSLSSVGLNTLKGLKHCMVEDLYNRALHVITENERVLEAEKYLISGDIKKLGIILNASQESLRNKYEVSTEKIDFLINALKKIDGVYGARVMGAGFGGSIISIVKKSSVNNIKYKLTTEYSEKYSITPDFITCRPSNGTSRINMDNSTADGFCRQEVVKNDGRILYYYNFKDER